MTVAGPQPTGFSPRKPGFPLIRIVLSTVLMTLAILFILPIAQSLSDGNKKRTLVEVSTANLAPPEPPPPEPPPPPEEEEEEQEPELDDAPPPMDISQLEAALNPGIGDAIAGMADIGGWGVMPDVMDDLTIFTVADLDSGPRLRRKGAFEFDNELIRQFSGSVIRVRIRIDHKGEVTVMRILDSPHRDFDQPIKVGLSRTLFHPLIRNGEPLRPGEVLDYAIRIPVEFVEN